MVPDRFYFNPRSHEGSDFVLFPYFVQSLRFQSTLPRGERRYLPLEDSSYRKFQSTLPRGERRLWQQEQTLPLPFQSTLPRGERPCVHTYVLRCCISIHAPTRGATHQLVFIRACSEISIHAPTRGATQTIEETHLLFQFQSTLPRGERQICPEVRVS